MTSGSVTRRLTQASELRDLCVVLMKAGQAHREKLRAEAKQRADTAEAQAGNAGALACKRPS